MIKHVAVAVVKTRHIYSDLFQWFRNLLGMNLVSYEDMIEAACKEAFEKLERTYPGVFDVQLSTAQTTNGAAEIIAYGKVEVPEDQA